MREIYIKYNPYKVMTEIKIDGKPLKRNSKLNFEDMRLQEWVEELPDLLFEEFSTRDFKLKFHGTILDYEDIVATVEDAKKKNINIKLEHIRAKEVKDKEEAIQKVFDEIKEGPFEELRQPDVVKAFNMAKSSDFEVNVVATMSAGKSTLINALLQQKLMPAKQEACTATITEIKDNDADNFMARVFNKDGTLIQTLAELTYPVMEKLNSNPDVSRIHAEGNIPFVSADDVSLVLVDTPGPNNSRDPEHKAATYRMLSESSKTVVLYIMNATQLAVNDDFNLLSYVADSMRVGGKQSRDRFIFVVNKLDDFKKGEDSVESAITKVRDYLKDNGIENPNIYPASALTALDIRSLDSDRTASSLKDTVENAMKGQFPGIKIKDDYTVEKIQELLGGIKHKSISSVTCVANSRATNIDNNQSFVQGLEKLILSMQGEKYTGIVIANGTTPVQLRKLRREYENIYTKMSAFKSTQVTYSSNKSINFSFAETNSTNKSINKTITSTETEGETISSSKSYTHGTSEESMVGKTLKGVAGAASILGASLAPITGGTSLAVGGVFSGAVSMLGSSVSKNVSDSETVGKSNSKNTSKSTGISDGLSEGTSYGNTKTGGYANGMTEGMTLTLHDKTIEGILERIDKQLKRIDEFESIGMYECAAYFLSENQYVSEVAASTYKALMRGENSGVEVAATNSWGNLDIL